MNQNQSFQRAKRLNVGNIRALIKFKKSSWATTDPFNYWSFFWKSVGAFLFKLQYNWNVIIIVPPQLGQWVICVFQGFPDFSGPQNHLFLLINQLWETIRIHYLMHVPDSQCLFSGQLPAPIDMLWSVTMAHWLKYIPLWTECLCSPHLSPAQKMHMLKP